MGCDIHSAVEVKVSGDSGLQVIGDKWLYVGEPMFPGWRDGTFTNEPFDERNYALFGFLADVRNEAAIPPIAEPRGFPNDVSDEVREMLKYGHSISWLTLRELLDFDYTKTFEDQGDGQTTSYWNELGETYFRDLGIMEACFGESPNDVRVVFCFDS